MGGTKSKPQATNTAGAVVNEVLVGSQSQVEITDIKILLYIITLIAVLIFVITIYKMWHNSLKKRYMKRGLSMQEI